MDQIITNVTQGNVIQTVGAILDMQSFWYLLLVLILASSERFKIGAILLLVVHIINGYLSWWHLAVIAIVMITLESFRSHKNEKFIKETLEPINSRLKRLENDRWGE